MTPETLTARAPITPETVHEVLGRTILADGFDMVVDLEKSTGCRLWDSRNNRWLLDLFSYFASAPIGANHPKMKDATFQAALMRAALANPTNSDIYTVEFAAFVDAFQRLAMPKSMKYAFFVAGGALGVENAIKAAFDWKVRKNRAAGRIGATEEKGFQVLHFREAFHGRSGYTLSLTNTDPVKTALFPKFQWPRVTNPKAAFPLEDANLAATEALEAQAIAEIKAAFAANADDIAAVIIETIQGEGGDNHFRPAFFAQLRALCNEFEAMLVVDEVQAGMGLTGTMWAVEQMGIEPDMIAFGKKAQVCGFMCGPRIDEVEDHVFKKSSRINSTWGGNLVDMVRCQRYLEIIHEDNLLENAHATGAYLLGELQKLCAEFPTLLSNPRGRGLMCAFSLSSAEKRNEMVERMYTEGGLIVLGSGPQSIRFRPPLIMTPAEIDEAVKVIRMVASEMVAAG